jgi:ABC-type transport system involved in cytochrome c biogenesis ATPase subunit
VLAASLASGCHVVLEGPPGTGKSTLLRAVADGAGLGVELVEGDAELTPRGSSATTIPRSCWRRATRRARSWTAP